MVVMLNHLMTARGRGFHRLEHLERCPDDIERARHWKIYTAIEKPNRVLPEDR